MVATSDDGLGRYLEPRTSDVLEYTARRQGHTAVACWLQIKSFCRSDARLLSQKWMLLLIDINLSQGYCRAVG